MAPRKNPAADRSHGGPGSSEQNAAKPQDKARRGPRPGEPTSGERSQVSGGGGERDIHKTHDPAMKS
ncbi:MAG TPA: hypothetical protein VFA50_05870 [Stellaceae bacterium]|nr:hypothetical protein [Stellaceae bacterium]